MTTKRLMAGGAVTRTSKPGNWARPPGLAMLGLVMLGLIQAGCRSDGCYDCNIGAKLSNGVQALAAKVTKHFDGCHGGTDCGCGGYGGETVIDSGTPVISGGMVVPMPGTVVPGPAIEQAPTQLDPIPSKETSGSSTNPTSTRSTPTGNTRSSYTTMAPKGTTAQRRGADVSRALHSSPESSASNDLVDNIPPVDLSPEVTKNATSAAKPTPAPTAAATPAATTPAATPVASPAATSAPTPIADPTTPPTAEKVSAAEGAIGTLPSIDAPSPFRAPGINRYASVAPTIYGGSAPSTEGLEWLKEKGCRTLIDLRKPSEVDPNFVESVNDRNMVYISLPIVAIRLDPSRLARFDDLVSASDNRPIYFCDTDGTRSGLVWYIHLRAVNQEDPQTATGKAEEVGLTEVEAKLAEAYLVVNKPRPRVSSARVALANNADREPFKIEMPPVAAPAPATPAVPAPASQAPRSALPGGQPTVNSQPETSPSPSTEPSPSMLPGEDRPQASNQRFRDPAFWRPVAGLVMTAIGVPLAYWSRSAFNVSRATRARASLPGAVQTPSDAPAASDV